MATALLAVTGGAAALAGWVWHVLVADAALPTARAFSADSLVYDRSGRLIADVHPPGDTRLPVSLDEMAPVLVDATVSIEDRNFWNEGAVDGQRLLAAAFQNLTRGTRDQGASTISMQLAKVLYLEDDKSITYKLRQVGIAQRLEESMGKRRILEEYINDIYYGHGATGIEAAAHVYFGVAAKDLSLAQAAMLAGLPNAPALFDPVAHPDAARARQSAVLDALLRDERIGATDAVAARAAPLPIAAQSIDDIDLTPLFTRYVRDDISATFHLDPQRAGLRITTTLDLDLQTRVQQTVTTQVNRLGRNHVTDGAVVCIDPRSGEVLAWVGNAGAGHPGDQIDMASHPRAPGSTFKLFTYATVLGELRASMATPILDAPLTLPTGGGRNGTGAYTVHNYDQRYHGVLPLKEAFANSLNIPAVKVELLAGIPNILATARAMGVTTLPAPDNGYGYSLTLGAYPLPLWQLAQGASVFAAGGVLHPAHELLRVVDGSGHRLPLPVRKPRQAVDPGVAFIVDQILTHDENRALEFGRHSALTLPDHVVAAKTGTTSDFRDNLTVGWTPHLVTAAWVGNADYSPMLGTTGITGAAPIWHDVMEAALKGVPDDWPGPPSDVEQRSGDWFLPGTSAATGAKELSGTEPDATTAPGAILGLPPGKHHRRH